MGRHHSDDDDDEDEEEALLDSDEGSGVIFSVPPFGSWPLMSYVPFHEAP
jgi:hypothetical protein